MKIGFISDLHLPHWANRPGPKPHEMVARSVQKNKPDLLIDAGDLEQPELLLSKIEVPFFRIRGNHDFYHKEFQEFDEDCRLIEFRGVKIAMATLWGDLDGNNPLTAVMVRRYLNDFVYIDQFSTDRMYEVHCKHRKFLEGVRADVIVTHHTPSFRSVHPRYLQEEGIQSLVNFGFSSHLDSVVENSGAKLWVHGHTHHPFDYRIGSTRVICNPCGYPGENHTPYQPIYVEI